MLIPKSVFSPCISEIHVQTAQGDCFEAVMKHCHVRVRKYILPLKDLLDLVGEGLAVASSRSACVSLCNSSFHIDRQRGGFGIFL
jgi:hypothetical protein